MRWIIGGLVCLIVFIIFFIDYVMESKKEVRSEAPKIVQLEAMKTDIIMMILALVVLDICIMFY